MKVSSNLKDVLEFLGKEYSAKEIDFEVCVYRKLNKYYDVEITGCNHKRRPFRVYIWDITKGEGIAANIVKRSNELKTKQELKKWLDNKLSLFNQYNPEIHER